MAAPSVASTATTQDASNATSRNVTKPSGVASGDWLVHISAMDTGGTTITQPTDFTVVYDGPDTDDAHRLMVSVKQAGGSEPASYTIGSSSEIGSHAILRITGSAATTVEEFVNTLTYASRGAVGSTTCPSEGAYLNAAETLVLRICSTDSSPTITQPGSHTSHVSLTGSSSGAGLSVCSTTQASDGYAPTLFFSLSASDQAIGLMLALNSTTTVSTPDQPVIRGVSYVEPDAAVAMVYPKPYGTVDGDLLILLQASDVNVLLNPGSAFTSIQDDSNTAIFHHALRRIASSEGSSYTGSTTTSATKFGVLLRITGHDATTPVNNSSVATGSSSSPTVSDITPSVDNCLNIVSYAADDDDLAAQGAGFPAGYTDLITCDSLEGGDATFSASHKNQTTATATGTPSLSLGATEEWVAINLLIAPSAGAPDSGAGASTGSSTVTGAGRSEKRASGATGGTTTPVGAGSSQARAAGQTDGAAAVTGDGVAAIKGAGQTDGATTVTGAARSEHRAAGATDGSSTPDGQGRSEARTTGQTDGASQVQGAAPSELTGTGQADGTTTVTGAARSEHRAAGATDGSSATAGQGQSEARTTGQADGTTTVTGAARSEHRADSATDGGSTPEGQARSETRTTAQADGTTTVTGAAHSEARTTGQADGTTTVAAEGGQAGEAVVHPIPDSRVFDVPPRADAQNVPPRTEINTANRQAIATVPARQRIHLVPSRNTIH